MEKEMHINSFDIFRDMIGVLYSTEWWLQSDEISSKPNLFLLYNLDIVHLDFLRHTPQCLIQLNDGPSSFLNAKFFPPPLHSCLYFSAAATKILLLIFRFAVYRINRLKHTVFDFTKWWIKSAICKILSFPPAFTSLPHYWILSVAEILSLLFSMTWYMLNI